MGETIGGERAEEAVLRRYMLGDLPREQQEMVEKRLLQSDAYFELLLAIEQELVEDYVTGNLPQHETFERRLLSARQGREDADFLRALMRLAAARRAPPAPGSSHSGWSWSSLAGRLRPGRVSAALAFAALVLVLAAAAWMMTVSGLRARVGRLEADIQTAALRERELQKSLAEERARAESASARLQEEQQQRAKLEEELARAESDRGHGSTQRAPATPPVSIARAQTVTLRRDNVRGTSTAQQQELVIQPSTKLVRLELETLPQMYRSYRGRLQTAEGRMLSSLTRFQTVRDGVVALEIAADFLPAADLILKLDGISEKGTPEYLGAYAFRVRREQR
jgi:hypothetical protein